VTEFYYGVQEMARKADRSASSGRQWAQQLPAPEVVMVSSRPAGGWRLDTWKKFADARQEPLRADLLKTIAKFEEEELALYRKYH